MDRDIVIRPERGDAEASVLDEPIERRLAVAAGVELAARAWLPPGGSAGAKAPFVLLHGIASNARVWDTLARRLQAAGHAVYALDGRGHGRSDRPEGGYDLQTLANDLILAVEALALAPPVLVGHSLGASVALEAVAQRPDVARAIALIEGGLVDAAVQFASLEACLAGLALPHVGGMPTRRLEAYFRGANPAWSEDRLAGTMACFEVLADGTVEWWLSPERREAIGRGLWAQRAGALWPRIGVPALVVAADTGDAAWTAQKRTALDALVRVVPEARVAWLGGEHDVPAAAPEELAALLLSWLAGPVGAS